MKQMSLGASGFERRAKRTRKQIFLQQWFGLTDVAMQEALFDVPLYRQFATLGDTSGIPDRHAMKTTAPSWPKPGGI